MALKRDSYFSLSKGERRATLWLVIVLVLLVAARLVLPRLTPGEETTGTAAECETFRQELKEFGDSLGQEEPKRTHSRQTTARQPQQPKRLDPVPRED